MTDHSKRQDDHTIAKRYLSDAARFGETHDPEALARQIPKAMKQVRLGAQAEGAEAEPAPEQKSD